MKEQKLIETRLPVVWAAFHTLFNYPFSKMFDTLYCILANNNNIIKSLFNVGHIYIHI